MPITKLIDPTTRYCVTVWEEKNTYFSSAAEARQDYARLEKGGRYLYGSLYEWVGHPDQWNELDSFEHDETPSPEKG